MKASKIMGVVLLSGCVATDVGNPQDNPSGGTTEIKVEMEAFIEAQSPAALTLADGVELTEAWLVTTAIELEACEPENDEGESDNDEEDDRDYETVTATELLTGTAYPVSPLFALDRSDFCGFTLALAPVSADELPSGAPMELAGLSMLVRGSLKDGTPFEVQAQLEDALELEGEIHLDEARLNDLVVGFGVDSWLTQRDLGALSGRPIVLSEDENGEVYERFEDAVIASPRLFVGSTSRQPIARPEE